MKYHLIWALILKQTTINGFLPLDQRTVNGRDWTPAINVLSSAFFDVNVYLMHACINNESKYTCADLVGQIFIMEDMTLFHQKKDIHLIRFKMIAGCGPPPPLLKYGFQYQVHRASSNISSFCGVKWMRVIDSMWMGHLVYRRFIPRLSWYPIAAEWTIMIKCLNSKDTAHNIKWP